MSVASARASERACVDVCANAFVRQCVRRACTFIYACFFVACVVLLVRSFACLGLRRLLQCTRAHKCSSRSLLLQAATSARHLRLHRSSLAKMEKDGGAVLCA
jgi:hypothetical protein